MGHRRYSISTLCSLPRFSFCFLLGIFKFFFFFFIEGIFNFDVMNFDAHINIYLDLTTCKNPTRLIKDPESSILHWHVVNFKLKNEKTENEIWSPPLIFNDDFFFFDKIFNDELISDRLDHEIVPSIVFFKYSFPISPN